MYTRITRLLLSILIQKKYTPLFTNLHIWYLYEQVDISCMDDIWMMTRKLPVGDGESPAKFGCNISFVAIRQIPTTFPIYLEFAPFPNPKKEVLMQHLQSKH